LVVKFKLFLVMVEYLVKPLVEFQQLKVVVIQLTLVQFE
jgi:hypothetical protein